MCKDGREGLKYRWGRRGKEVKAEREKKHTAQLIRLGHLDVRGGGGGHDADRC